MPGHPQKCTVPTETKSSLRSTGIARIIRSSTIPVNRQVSTRWCSSNAVPSAATLAEVDASSCPFPSSPVQSAKVRREDICGSHGARTKRVTFVICTTKACAFSTVSYCRYSSPKGNPNADK